MLKRIVSLFIFLFFAGIPVLGDSVAFYVNNQFYDKPIFIYKGDIFADASEILTQLGFNVSRQGGAVCGGQCPADVSKSLLYVNGKPLNDGVSAHRGKVWVNIRLLARAIGYYYDFNPQTEIADLIRLRPIPPAEKEKTKEKPPSRNKNPLKAIVLKKEPIYANAGSNQLYPNLNIVFQVRNVSKADVEEITATLRLLDPRGMEITEQPFIIGTLPPGGSKQEEYLWYNSSDFYANQIKVNVGLDWKGKEQAEGK